MEEKPAFQRFALGVDMRHISIISALFMSGCAQFQPVIDNAINQAVAVNHAQYQVAELILCRGMSIGEWMRSIGPYPEKVDGWKAICVGGSIPNAPK